MVKYIKDSYDNLIDIETLRSIVDGKGGVTRTRVVGKDPITGEVMFDKSNKVQIDGSIFAACKLFDIVSALSLPTYNEAMELENTVTTSPTNPTKICLFALGTDGCGADASEIYDVPYKNWTDPSNLVPFRYPLTTADLSALLREDYFGRKVVNDHAAYYFKSFETEPELYIQYVDGTAITDTLYDSSITTAAEVVVAIKLRISKEDCREYFTSIASTLSIINSITLLEAWYTVSTYKYYQDIRPFSKLNISNEPLIDPNKGIEIMYYLYF